MEAFKTYTETELLTEDGTIESNCLAIGFKIRPGSGGVVEIDGFLISDGDAMFSDSNDYPGINVTKYRVKFITAGVLYVLRKKVIGQNENCS